MWINSKTLETYQFHSDIRKAFKNISMPKLLTDELLESFNIFPVTQVAPPKVGITKDIIEIPPKLENGVWLQAWSVVDMFQDYTDDEGVTHTKADQEAAYQADLDAKAAASVRSTRDAKIAETDWMALTDVTMSTEMAAYRQALRDITTHANFPYLQETDWPTKPE